MVSRLIEDDHVGLGVGEAGEGHAGLLASGDELHRLDRVVACDLVAAQVGPKLRLRMRGKQ